MVDAGSFLAYQDQPPKEARVGAFVEGDIYLGIDPFDYFERLSKSPGMPPLSYRWLIREIQLETTPWVEGRLPNGAVSREREDGKESFAPTAATNAWHDDGRNGHYVLSCVREEGPEAP